MQKLGEEAGVPWVVIDEAEVEMQTWMEDGIRVMGTKDIVDNKAHGIVRKVQQGGFIEEGVYKEGVSHGFTRFINRDGSYYTICYFEGQPSGEENHYDKNGTFEKCVEH